MQHVSDQHYRRPGMGSLTRHVVFTGWRCLCMLMALLCGVVTPAAADTHESGVTPAPVLGDLNGDGRDDVLLRHENGRWFYYPMDGRYHITDQRGYADLTRNLAWQFAGIGDLNGDGRDDVLVRHTDGRWFYYPMDGRYHITGERGLAGLTRNLDWHVAGMGDLNGDGKDDVLLRNKNGRWYYYPMNGRRFLTDERGYADLTRDLDWQVAGMGDLNGDGKDDVLLRHTDGRWDYYPMDGRNPIADQRGLAGLTRNLDWQVAGIGDLNGDGKDDVLLRHTDSRWYYYPMDGRRYLADERGYAGLTRNLAWQVAGIGDLNGDGRDDVLLRHTDSRWYYYPMDGRRFLTEARGYANLTRNPDWSIAAADPLTPTGAPDLVVESPSVSDSTLNTGDSFTLNATVRNRGAGRADVTTLRYYRSSDSTISSSDTQAGTDAVGGLAASGSDDKSTTLMAPSSAGTYYYGACVESVSGESDTGNNCSSGVSVTVSDSQIDGSATRYAVGDVVTTLPTGTWFPDVTSGSASFGFSDGNSVLNLGNGGYIEEGGFRYTCESTGGCEVRNREVRVGTIVQTPSGVAPEEIPPTSGTAGTCEVALGRSAGAGGTETVSVALSDALETDVGTLDAPFVVRARMDNSSDFDVYKIVLSDAGRLVVLSSGALDTQAVFLRSDCAETGRVVEDVGVLEGFAADNYNFTLGGDLSPGTYYMVVFEWASRIGNYTLDIGFVSDDGVNDTPVIEPVANQEVAPGGTATVDVKVTDDTGDAHTIVATSDNDDVATADLRGSGSTRSLVITAQAAGTATVTLRAADQHDAVATPVTFDVIVRSPTLPAPTLEPGSNDGELEVALPATFGPMERRAYDYQLRTNRPQTPWLTVGCDTFFNSSSSEATGSARTTIRGLPAGLTFDGRYRYRNSSSCSTGSPGHWSAVGEGTSGGTAANATPAFPEGASTDRSVNENVVGGINVGSPVAASDADGALDVLTYSLGGADAGSFQIVPATGQIRTRDGITYDHEARDTYFVTVEASDVHSETDLISVDIHIVDLGSICVSPPRLRLNSGDGELTVRWTPLADQAGSAAVLGYEIERRDGTGGVWGSRQIIGGRASSNTTYTGLVNGRQYDVRIRPYGDEDACDWSTPVSGIPTTDTAPQDQSDFEDRVPPEKQLRDWRFPVPGRFSETRDGRQIDGSYSYARTDANRGTITLEYDEIGRSGCEISLLFSSLTSGSFLDECEGAGVNVDVDFDIEAPPAQSSPLAPQTMEEFDALAIGKRNLLPGIFLGRAFSERVCPTCSPRAPGYFHRVRDNRENYGVYLYENEGRASGTLTLLFNHGDVWVFELEFIASDAAAYVVTIRRDGHAPLVLEGIIDFAHDSNLNEFPPELLPPGSPPQASGNDRLDVDAATGSTSLSIGGDSLQTILVQDGGIQDIAYQPGDWLEPKDGGNQRMMIVGSGQTSAPVAAGLVFRARTSAQARSVPLAVGQTDLIALSVVCMQREKGIPVRGSRFFSQPKSPDGTIQMCQRDCVVAGGGALQRCVWNCQNSADGPAAIVNDIGGTAVRQVFDTLGGRGVGGQIRSGVRSSGNNLKSRLFRID